MAEAADSGGAAAIGGGGSGATPSKPDEPEPTCPAECPKGETCVAGACCKEEHACGAECCADGLACSFQRCVEPGDECTDSGDCGEDAYCELSLGEAAPAPVMGCEGGETLARGRCLQAPPACADGEAPAADEPVTCLAKCELKPSTEPFAVELKASWDGQNVMMTPIVIELDDDDCNGIVDARDIPEIVFVGFPTTSPDPMTSTYGYPHATLWALSLVKGAFVEKWHLTATPQTPITGSTELAAGNIDGLPGNEVVVCTSPGVVAVSGSGNVLWRNAEAGCRVPGIADVDRDGKPEVITENRILNGEDGTMQSVLAGGANIAVDVAGDGDLEIVTANAVYDRTGTALAMTGLPGGNPAIGDFDHDGNPEIVAMNPSTHLLAVWHYDEAQLDKFEILRTGIDINGTAPNVCPAGSAGSASGGGPPTVADFNGDGTPDVAAAGGIGYAVIDGTKILDATVPPNQANLWLAPTHDCSSAQTGSSVFDFNGDGRAEVVYSDEQYLRVYDGSTGDVLWKTCNTTGTLIEFPIVADVDADGHADVVVAANNYASGSITCPDDGSAQTGVRVFGDSAGHWVRTRRVWNQHAYHVTNIEEDGTVPKEQEKNWLNPRLNDFRQNVQPNGELSAPDLVVVLAVCTPSGQLVATVRNVGSAEVPAGVVVAFYEERAAGAERIGEVATPRALAPAESIEVVLDTGKEPTRNTVYAVVDDGGPVHTWLECRTDNNKSAPVPFECKAPQ